MDLILYLLIGNVKGERYIENDIWVLEILGYLVYIYNFFLIMLNLFVIKFMMFLI